MTDRIRVLLVDDDALVRAGLKMMLAGASQIEVVGEADDGRGVLKAVDLHHPDVVLMDIRMPRLDGIAATRLLRTQPRPPSVLVLTTFDADELVLRALQAGAAGLLLKDSAPADIARAIETVYAGDATLSPAIARRLITLVAGDHGAAARQEHARQLLASLTAREREVALAVGQGQSNTEIASQLYMSLATVKAHVSRLLTKLSLTNRVQIALLVHDAATWPLHPGREELARRKWRLRHLGSVLTGQGVEDLRLHPTGRGLRQTGSRHVHAVAKAGLARDTAVPQPSQVQEDAKLKADASGTMVHRANDNDTHCPPGSWKEPACTRTRTTTANSLTRTRSRSATPARSRRSRPTATPGRDCLVPS